MKKRHAKPEAEVAEFWLTHDSADRIDWSGEGVTLGAPLRFAPDAERPTRAITVRLPRRLVQDLHVLAKTRNVSEAALVKMLLADKVAELRRGRAA